MYEKSLGWHPELPDHRDWMIDSHPEASQLFFGRALFSDEEAATAPSFPFGLLPKSVDLRKWCSPIENQGALGSCTAQAGVGLVEYMERRARKTHIDGSRLFVYKVTRKLLGWTGDTGAYVRTTMKAMKAFGVPPEKHWPYDIPQFDEEPTPFVYAYGQSFKTIRYFRIDQAGQSLQRRLELIRSVLAVGLAVNFGFVVYNWGNDKGEFLVPGPTDRPYGGHAVLAVGYDDERRIGDSVGALRIRNSWSTNWGDKGYGWLPYDYVLKGYSSDFWTIFSQGYLID